MSDKEEPKEGVVNNYSTHTVEKHPFVVDWDCMVPIMACLCALAAIAAIAWGITTYNINANEKMAEAIKNGAHPMDAYCAFDGSSEDKVCLVRAALTGKEVK